MWLIYGFEDVKETRSKQPPPLLQLQLAECGEHGATRQIKLSYHQDDGSMTVTNRFSNFPKMEANNKIYIICFDM